MRGPLRPGQGSALSGQGRHHRLARDAQLIVFDERGVGNGWLLPAGPLREPPALPFRSVVRLIWLRNAAALLLAAALGGWVGFQMQERDCLLVVPQLEAAPQRQMAILDPAPAIDLEVLMRNAATR